MFVLYLKREEENLETWRTERRTMDIVHRMCT